MTAPQATGAATAGSNKPAAGRLRALIFGLAMAAPLLFAAAPASAQDSGYMRITAAEAAAGQTISLGVNKSMVIDLPRPAGDVLVSNPEIADAVLRSSTRLYLIGVKLGQANVFLFDSAGGQIGSLEISVAADLNSLNQLLAEAIPDGFVRADALNGSIVLRGQVRSSSDSSRASELTRAMIAVSPTEISTTTSGATPGAAQVETSTFDPANGPGVINLITITGEEQVALKVTIAEVQRTVAKQLGVNVAASFTDGDFSIGDNIVGSLAPGRTTRGLSPITTNPLAGTIGAVFTSGGFDIAALVQALDETGMIRTLAEPTLTAVSGETANFLAGGEFGYPVDSGDDTTTVEFKPFGVQLSFTPIVLSPGRISIKVRTSFSEITDIEAGIPSLATRSVETTVEQPSGGAFAIGGLVQHVSRREVRGFPGLQKLPILGLLFSSREFQNDQTELVVIVTPYLVKPTSPAALGKPDDNMALAGDADAYFLNRLTKVYGAASDPASTAGRTGFTFD